MSINKLVLILALLFVVSACSIGKKCTYTQEGTKIESLLTDVEDIQSEIKESRHNAVNILRLQKDVDKILEQIETLKDKVRNNGNHSQ